MSKSLFYKKRAIVLVVVLVVLFALYLFFTKTNRGSSLVLYSIAGWGAPLHTRIDCGKETDKLVSKKFELPLKFDKQSKFELRGFWYYSYYRACLFKNGYDFKGEQVPQPTVKKEGTMSVYKNPYVGFQFFLPSNTILQKSNVLDVDTDDRLLTSLLTTENNSNITVRVYLHHDDYQSLTDVIKNPEGILPEKTPVTDIKEVKNKYNISLVRIIQNNGTINIVTLTSDKKVISISGTNLPLLEFVQESFSFL